MIESMRAFARAPASIASLVGSIALPICQAVLAHMHAATTIRQ